MKGPTTSGAGKDLSLARAPKRYRPRETQTFSDLLIRVVGRVFSRNATALLANAFPAFIDVAMA